MPRETRAQREARLDAEAKKMQEPVFFAMPAELAQETVNYLLRHPAGEVLHLIDAFRSLEVVQKEEEKVAPTS